MSSKSNDDCVLLTGATGFIGGHILDRLLKVGYHVLAPVRSEAKAEYIRRQHTGRSSQLDIVVVEDITTPGAFRNALGSSHPITLIIHTASPFSYQNVNCNNDLLEPAVKGTLNILETAADVSSVRRIVITGSIASVIDYSGSEGLAGDHQRTYTALDWNPVTLEEAMSTDDMPTVYRASKTFAEKAAWNFMKNKAPSYDLVTLLPPMVYGPLLFKPKSIEHLNESNLRIWNLFLSGSEDDPMPPNGVYMFIDVRDLATAHLEALTAPGASNRRIIVSHDQVSSQQVADVLRSAFPHARGRIPCGDPGASGLPANAYTLDSRDADVLFGLGFHNMSSTFVDLAKQLLEVGRD